MQASPAQPHTDPNSAATTVPDPIMLRLHTSRTGRRRQAMRVRALVGSPFVTPARGRVPDTISATRNEACAHQCIRRDTYDRPQ